MKLGKAFIIASAATLLAIATSQAAAAPHPERKVTHADVVERASDVPAMRVRAEHQRIFIANRRVVRDRDVRRFVRDQDDRRVVRDRDVRRFVRDRNDRRFLHDRDDRRFVRDRDDRRIVRDRDNRQLVVERNGRFFRVDRDDVVFRRDRDDFVFRPDGDDLLSRPGRNEFAFRSVGDHFAIPEGNGSVFVPDRDDFVFVPDRDDFMFRPGHDDLRLVRDRDRELSRLAVRPEERRESAMARLHERQDNERLERENTALGAEIHQMTTAHLPLATRQRIISDLARSRADIQRAMRSKGMRPL